MFKLINTYSDLLGALVEPIDDGDWALLSGRLRLSENFIREFADKVNWFHICRHQNLSEDFIREFRDKVEWIAIFEDQQLTDEFKVEFQGRYTRAREDSIRETVAKWVNPRIDWDEVSTLPGLSEDFIREFKDRLNVPTVLEYRGQKLSDGLFEELTDYMAGLKHFKYSPEFAEAFDEALTAVPKIYSEARVGYPTGFIALDSLGEDTDR